MNPNKRQAKQALLKLFNSKPGKLEKQFAKFHEDNPVVYSVLVMHAREWKNAGHQHCGIKTLWEIARWTLKLKKQCDGFKLNNNYHPFYARLIDEQEPDLKGIFRFRRQRVPATFGPHNDALEDGRHRA
jgi:hypothetical protein